MESSFFSKILVCTESSDCSGRALKKACAIAKNNNSKLYLIYVIDNPTKRLGLGIDLIDKKEYLKILREHGKSVLKKSKKIALDLGITPHEILKEGNVSKEILNFVKKEKIDLVAIGSRGFSKLPRFVLGSLSNKIINQCPCPVLVVK